MKKIICFSLVMILILTVLTSCNFTQTVNDVAANNAKSTSKVEAMISALAEDRMSDAEALMHPQAKEKSDTGIAQIKLYIDGRKAEAMTLQSINVTNSVGISGKASQEQVTFKVALSGGEIVHITSYYLSNNAGEGFISFQMVLGVI